MNQKKKPPQFYALVVVCILVGVLIAWGVSSYLLKYVLSPPPGEVLRGQAGERIAKAFEAAYTEGKDLGKTFLTLISAVFVASITFSEKIVDLKTASGAARAALIACWALLLLSIIACGMAFVYLALSFNTLTFEDLPPFKEIWTATLFFACAGVFFVLGLFMMLLAGLPSLMRGREA